MVGRVLRSLSHGNIQFCELWRDWTLTKDMREECGKMWSCLRPPTNCDEPAIVRAREYIHENMDQFTDSEQRALAAESNLMMKSIIADASTMMRNSVLDYWSDSDFHNDNNNNHKKRLALGKGIVRKNIVTSGAIYSYDAEALQVDIVEREMPESGNDGADKCPSIGQFEELQDVRACIVPGSIINIKENVSSEWYFVDKVDVLFARLYVYPCHAPPLPWLGLSQLSPLQSSAMWLPVSRLWFALVCSRIESSLGSER